MNDLPCHRCNRLASWHVEIVEGEPRVFACDEHQKVKRQDDHPIGDHCTDPAATWLGDGCFVVTAAETALAAAFEALADDQAVKGIGRLDPGSEYYGMSGLWVDDGVTLARLLTRSGWTGSP